MPRNLTDLMERATSFAPPEPHAAGDITRLAVRRHRRRTTMIAAGAALSVVAVAGIAMSLADRRPSQPQPADNYKHNQTVRLSQAIPASSLPGYKLEPWRVPSVQHLGGDRGPVPTYIQVNSRGGVLFQHESKRAATRFSLGSAPGESPLSLQPPPSPGSESGQPIGWLPSLLGDAHLVWLPTSPAPDRARRGFHITDLQGGHDRFVPNSDSQLRVGGSLVRPGQGWDGVWVWGDHFWFLVGGQFRSDLEMTPETLYSATFSGSVTKVADNVAVASEHDGVVGWVTTDGHVGIESAAGGSPQSVPVPLDNGCRMLSAHDLWGSQPLVAAPGLVALVERCGTGRHRLDELLAFDPSGHLLVHLPGLYTVRLSLAGDALVLRAENQRTGAADQLRYDLVTGSLARLSPTLKKPQLVDPTGAGDYVLWYDTTGGHVAKIPN